MTLRALIKRLGPFSFLKMIHIFRLCMYNSRGRIGDL